MAKATSLLLLLLYAIHLSHSDFVPAQKDTYDAALFVPEDKVKVMAPSAFPKPTDKIVQGDDDTVLPIVQPVAGFHRSTKDAVLAYAEGYRLSDYMMFIETLKETGFDGDVVLAIAEDRIIKPNVKEYLSSMALDDDEDPNDDGHLHVVLYQIPLDCDEQDGSRHRKLIRSGETDSFQMCQLSHVYGYKNGTTVPDPRKGRVVATLRYEWYWIWSLQYNANQWLMLIDARDTYFQTNPFANLPRQQSAVAGRLYLFGENAQATRLGISRKNANWLQRGYGDFVRQTLAEKPTICSGGTMGEQVALETYLRAMVNEHDECDIKMTGSDQGFHNYLYYSSKLHEALSISQIIVWEQGRGMINNLGAMRTQPLLDWGVYEGGGTTNVYQWDGTSLSPVVHQWDRDNQLHKAMKQRHRNWEHQWNTRKVDGGGGGVATQ